MPLTMFVCRLSIFWTEYRIPENAGFLDFALYPVRGGVIYFERLNYFFGWRFIIMMAVMYSLVKGFMHSLSDQVCTDRGRLDSRSTSIFFRELLFVIFQNPSFGY